MRGAAQMPALRLDRDAVGSGLLRSPGEPIGSEVHVRPTRSGLIDRHADRHGIQILLTGLRLTARGSGSTMPTPALFSIGGSKGTW